MNRLLEIGFDRAGHWCLDQGKLKFELTRHATRKNILYAFVCDGEVKYVGKTVQALALRMSGYKTPGKSQITNSNNHRRIKDLLAGDVAVDIYALPDGGLLHYGKFHLNLAAALEDDIIKIVDPEWNGGKPEPLNELLQAGFTETLSAPPAEVFTLTLQPTYYQRGFFNVDVSSQRFFGADGETIELFLGSNPQPVLGTINRRTNTNGTPRIMGGAELRDWFSSNAKIMDCIAISVLSPTSIRLASA